MRIFAIIIIFFSLTTWAADKSQTKKPFKVQREIDLKEESIKDEETIIIERNSQNGLVQAPYNTLSDTSKFAFSYHINGDLMNAASLKSIEASYSRRLTEFWWDFFYSQTTGSFKEFGKYNTSIRNPDEELALTSETLTTLGSGVSYRSRYLRHLFKATNLFENLASSITYNTFSEKYYGESFKGPGLRAQYGVHFRGDSSFFYGANASYHLMTLRKPYLIEGDTASNRSLNLSYVTFAVEIGWFL
jgi:hypothetical protein